MGKEGERWPRKRKDNCKEEERPGKKRKYFPLPMAGGGEDEYGRSFFFCFERGRVGKKKKKKFCLLFAGLIVAGKKGKRKEVCQKTGVLDRKGEENPKGRGGGLGLRLSLGADLLKGREEKYFMHYS